MFLAKFLLASLFSLSAFAGVGDFSAFNGQAESDCGAKTEKFLLAYTVMDEKPELGLAKVHEEVLWLTSLQRTRTEISLPLLDARHFTRPSKVKSYCKQVSGQVEKLKVPAGTFWTCRVTQESSEGWLVTTWIGAAPLGIIAVSAQESEDLAQICPRKFKQELERFEFAESTRL